MITRRKWFAPTSCSILVLLTGLYQAVPAGFEPGEITFAEMNCVACHQASPAAEQRLASRRSPLLGPDGVLASPTWLRDFLLNPQKENPGSLMPDTLHGLPAVDKKEAVEALAHYLVALQCERTNVATRLDPAVVKEGGALFHKVGCVACHAPQELPVASVPDLSGDAPKEPPGAPGLAALATNSVPMGNLAKKYTVDALAVFLRDPLKSRPSGRMPAQRLSEKEARAIAMYLLRDQPTRVPPSKIPGLNFEHYEWAGTQLPDFATLTPASTGYIANVTLKRVPHTNSTSVRFRGVLTVAQEGDYTFWTESRDGSQLFIDNRKVVDNDGVHNPTEKEAKTRLTAGDHNIVVSYFHHTGRSVLKVSWAGPGFEKQEIPGALLSLMDNGRFMHLAEEQPFVLDVAQADKGRQLFEKYNCAACHEVNQPGYKAQPLEKLAASEKGCLSPKPAANVPRFAFTTRQRQELAQLLGDLPSLEQPLAPANQVRRTMTALNCYACHSSDDQIAPAVLRRAYFKVNGSIDLGEEGSIPPHLNGVGAKLKPQWMEKVLVNGASVRPYMATRMPQYGEANVKPLMAAFQEADAAQASGHDIPVDPVFVNGLRLVGSEGLSCIACHTFAGHPSLGAPALDLTTTPERLNADWFRRYLLNPAKLRPGTRMPQFWPDGVAANKSILDGDTEKQIAAIWSYLAGGKAPANLPTGLLAPKMELLPKSEPLIYRNFIQGAGTRAIGVGYPEKVNLAFDANQMCLALMWHGQFMDASRHWTGRGEGWQPPLGYGVVKLPTGAPFASLANSKTAWPTESGKQAGYQFRGYTYDAQRRPEFRYQFDQIEITDSFLPVKMAKEEPRFQRKLALSAGKAVANLWFRAAAADKVEAVGDFAFLVDGNLRLTFPSLVEAERHPAAQTIVRSSEGKMELLVPVRFEDGRAEVVEEISW